MSYGSTFISHTHWGTKLWGTKLWGTKLWGTKLQAHHLDAGSGEEYEIDLSAVDIKPEIYAQTVYSIS